MTLSQVRRNLVKFIRGWGFSIAAALLIATSFKSAIADWNDVPTGSMIPTILAGDRVFINKLSYGLKLPYTTWHILRWQTPQRGDIVVFYSPKDGKRLIKRMVAVPGDEIALYRNQVFLNGKPLKYEMVSEAIPKNKSRFLNSKQYHLIENLDGVRHSVIFTSTRSPLDSFDPVIVPPNKVFVMGDNRNNSTDSRVFGFIDIDQVVGRATHIALSRDGSFLKPRWSRFFQKLS